MKRTLFLGIALSVLASSVLVAQDKITVKGGSKFAYALSSEMSMTQAMAGQEMSVETNSNGTVQVVATKVGKDRIDWSYGVSNLKVRVSGDMLPNGGQDTTLSMEPVNFVTDLKGTVLEAGKLSEAMQMLGSGMQEMSAKQMFSPALVRSAKIGDTWEIAESDTVQNPAMGGAVIVIDRTTKYTFDGTVDTLKTKAARIYAEVTSMTIHGSGDMMGAEIKIDGDGSSSVTSYYSTKDGLLLAATGDNETAMRMALTGQMEMVIPMTLRMKSTMVRQ